MQRGDHPRRFWSSAWSPALASHFITDPTPTASTNRRKHEHISSVFFCLFVYLLCTVATARADIQWWICCNPFSIAYLHRICSAWRHSSARVQLRERMLVCLSLSPSCSDETFLIMTLELFFRPNNHHMVIQVGLTAVKGKKRSQIIAEQNSAPFFPPSRAAVSVGVWIHQSHSHK